MSKRRRASSVSYRYLEEDSLDSFEASTSSGPTMRKRKKYFDPMEACQQLIDILRNHKKDDGSLLSESFIRVPKRRQEPAYYDVVSNPIDLLKIQQKLKMDEYDDIDDLQSDVELIVNNTKAFYKKNSQEFKDATELWDLFISSKNKIIGVEEEPKPPVNNKHPPVKNSKRSVSKIETKNSMNHDEDNSPEDSTFEEDGVNPFEELFEAVMIAKDDHKKLLHPAFQLLPSKKKYPDYYEVVEQPVDLKMVALKVQNNKYKFLIEMERDLLLMCKNACLYNEPGSQIYKQAKVLRKIIQMKRIEIDQGKSLPATPNANSAPVKNSANRNSGTTNSNRNSSQSSNKNTPVVKNAVNKSTNSRNATPNATRNSGATNGNRSRSATPLGGGKNNATPLGSGRNNATPKHGGTPSTNRNSLTPGSNKSGEAPNSIRIAGSASRQKRKKGTSLSAATSVLKDNFSDAEGELEEDPRAAAAVDLNNPQWKLFESVRTAIGSNGNPLCDPFWKLPSRRLYPDYYREIKNPMSLGQIRKKLVLKLYGTVSEVAGDLTIMFENAKKYNIATSKLYKDAVKLQTMMQVKVQELLDVDQLFTENTATEETPVRRKPGPKPKNPTPGSQTPSKGRPPKDSFSLKKRLHTLAKYMLDYTCEDGRKPMLAFMEKPSKKLYPGYYKVIAEPIDFLEIESKIKAEQYSCENDLVNDFKLMFSNCRQFNEENSPIYEDANLLEKILLDKISQPKPINVTPEKPKRERIVLKPYKPRRILSPLERTLKSLYESIRYYREPKDNRQLSQIFMKLPSKIDYPDYYEVITHPIDMEKMAHKIRANDYENLDELVADFVLMFDNACKYNEPDSQIYKDALVLQRFCFQTKMQLKEDDNTVPDFHAAVQDIFLNLFTNVYNYQDDEGRCYSDSMSDLPEHDEIDGKKVRALSLDLLKRRLDKGAYKRLDTFQEDFFSCMERARRLSRTDSQIFEDAVELQLYFIKQRDELCRHGELLSSPALCYTESDAKAAIEQIRSAKALKESLDDETETRSSDDSLLIKDAAANATTMGDSTMTCNQRTFKVGEFVYLDAKEKACCEPHILYIERLWENDGRQMLYGNYYLRPAETYHLTTRKFLEREVFKSDSHVAVPLEEVRDRCCVVNVKYYFTMRPEGYDEKDIYVCESRYSTRLRSFKKIKIYPENPTLKLVPREVPLQPKRVMSVFRERVEKHKDELQELEDLEKFEERDRPNVVAFHSMDIDDGNTYYEQFNTICSGVVKTGDYVYVVAEGGKQIIAQIDSIWETKDGKCYFRGPWFVTPSEIPHSPNRLFYKQEVFLSSLEDANPIVSIIGKCSVLEVNDFIMYRLTEIPESDVFICTSMYDEINRQVKKLTADGLKKYSHSSAVTEDEIYFFTKMLSPPKVSLAVKKPEEPKTETPSALKVESSLQLTEMNDMDILMEDSLDGGPPSVGSGEIPVVVPNPGTATPVITTPAPTKKKSNKNKVVTGYILYSREVRKQIVQNNPESKFGDISRIVGSEWKSLPQHEKQQWEEKASKLNEETKALFLLDEQCSSPAALPPPPPVDVIYECLWDNCDYQFEEVADLIEHCIKDKESQGHVQAFYAENQISEFNCYWRNCGRNKKNVQPFPNIQRLIRHVRDMHINKGNGRSVPPESRSKNFKHSSKPQVVNRPSSSATPNLPVSTTSVLTSNTQKVQEPMFISVPPRPQRVLHSEAYIKYIEGLQAETKHITPWERTLQATQENTPATPDTEKLQTIAAWLGRKADQHDNVVAALWSLRNQLLRDTLGLHKTL